MIQDISLYCVYMILHASAVTVVLFIFPGSPVEDIVLSAITTLMYLVTNESKTGEFHINCPPEHSCMKQCNSK